VEDKSKRQTYTQKQASLYTKYSAKRAMLEVSQYLTSNYVTLHSNKNSMVLAQKHMKTSGTE
jgi:hypothetical protein